MITLFQHNQPVIINIVQIFFVRIKIKFNNNVPEQWKKSKLMKRFTLIAGLFFILSAVISMVIKTFCAENSGLYQSFSGSNIFFNFILGGISLYVYICITRQSNS